MPINKADYVYNNVGNRTSLTDKRGVQAFGYDQLDRLTSASHPLLLDPQAFAYDAVGNRTTGGSVVNAGNQLTADANYTYQYDDNGNLTRKTLLATGNYTQYTYDPENRLTQVQEFAAGNPTAITTSSYRYDGLGRRIEKVGNGQTKRYIYDGEDILLEYDGANALQARYTHGPGIDEPIAVTKGASTFFYHQDGLGTVTELTDSNGTIAKAYAYDAYGNLLESPGTVEQPYTYTGREFDAETGLYYYRARYYDAMTGRFLQKDPIGYPGDINFYRYVRNIPTKFADPYGLFELATPGQVINFWGEFFGGIGDFMGTYIEMRQANWKTPGTDKYFHCKANCEAAQRGPEGEAVACRLSDIREWWDQNVKGFPVSDSVADQVANQYGRSEGAINPGKPCNQICAPFRPSNLPPQY
ncbi:MAG: hypothetical protein HY348_05170 [Nitrospira defluvii]|nr:hypothetical protein [Nitrospira defluvii]